MEFLDDLYMKTVFLENYALPKAPPQTTTSEEEQIEERIQKVKQNILNIYRGLDTLRSEPNLERLVQELKRQLRPAMRKMVMRITIDQPTRNLTPLELRQKIATIQGLFGSTSLQIERLKGLYEKHGLHKMVNTLDQVEAIINSPAHSFSKYVFEPIKHLLTQTSLQAPPPQQTTLN